MVAGVPASYFSLSPSRAHSISPGPRPLLTKPSLTPGINLPPPPLPLRHAPTLSWAPHFSLPLCPEAPAAPLPSLFRGPPPPPQGFGPSSNHIPSPAPAPSHPLIPAPAQCPSAVLGPGQPPPAARLSLRHFPAPTLLLFPDRGPLPSVRPASPPTRTWAMRIHFSSRCALCGAARPGGPSTEPSTQPVTVLNWVTVARTVGATPAAPGRSRCDHTEPRHSQGRTREKSSWAERGAWKWVGRSCAQRDVPPPPVGPGPSPRPAGSAARPPRLHRSPGAQGLPAPILPPLASSLRGSLHRESGQLLEVLREHSRGLKTRKF